MGFVVVVVLREYKNLVFCPVELSQSGGFALGLVQVGSAGLAQRDLPFTTCSSFVS